MYDIDSLDIPNGNTFRFMHPYEDVIFPTDKYYADLAKKILPMLVKMRTALSCPQEVVVRMALCIAAYFEDQISQLGLWSSFIHRYRELYGRWLPWYDTSEDYYEDEVNLQDVKFLIWIILVSTQGQVMSSPEHPAIETSAKRVFDLLMDEFESAPSNEPLVKMVYDKDITKDIFSLRNVLHWMVRTCYLMAVPTWETEARAFVKETIYDIVAQRLPLKDISYLASAYNSMRMRVGPLALYPNEWYVLMRRHKGIEKDNDKILAIKSTPFYPFLVLSADDKTINLISCRGEEYKVDTKSFMKFNKESLQNGDIIMTSLVRYKGKWGINGLSFLYSEAAKRSKDINPGKELGNLGLKMMEDGKAFDLFHLPDTDFTQKIDPSIKRRLNIAIKENNGKRLFYFPNSGEALKWMSQVTGEDDPQAKKDIDENIGEGPFMIYVGTDYHMVASKFVFTIADPENPYFDPERAYEGSDILFNIFGVPNEFIKYIIENNYFANLGFSLKDDKKKDWNLIKDNLPFWASFIRQYPCKSF